MAHSHRGKSSKAVLDEDAILRTLRIIPGQTLLDAGCGDGYMAREFARALGGEGVVHAIDVDGDAIARLRAETEGTIIEAMEADMTGRTPLRSSSIDLVYLSMVFHGFSRAQVDGFRAEVMRVLKPG
ncbi:MAG: class I SAM-dependent methyltransferase, partial [Planctomycetes bacterium]|nr:class I SAM-dependent methyltransferase [Planctomycetota bacterium]